MSDRRALRALVDRMPLEGVLDGLAHRAGLSPEDFDPRALAEGIAVECEHTSDGATARQIAMDHLTEDPNYYRKLALVERL